jgi:hypothetical protein
MCISGYIKIFRDALRLAAIFSQCTVLSVRKHDFVVWSRQSINYIAATVKPPPKQVKKAPDGGVPDENVEKKEHGGPAPAAKQDKQTVLEAPTSNGRLTSHPLEQAPKGLVDHLNKNDSKMIKRESIEEGEGHAFNMKAEEARLNAVEEGNRENSERWWLRKPKPREARKERRVEKGRTTVWAEPVLLDEVEVLAMPYVTYL